MSSSAWICSCKSIWLGSDRAGCFSSVIEQVRRLFSFREAFTIRPQARLDLLSQLRLGDPKGIDLGRRAGVNEPSARQAGDFRAVTIIRPRVRPRVRSRGTPDHLLSFAPQEDWPARVPGRLGAPFRRRSDHERQRGSSTVEDRRKQRARGRQRVRGPGQDRSNKDRAPRGRKQAARALDSSESKPSPILTRCASDSRTPIPRSEKPRPRRSRRSKARAVTNGESARIGMPLTEDAAMAFAA